MRTGPVLVLAQAAMMIAGCAMSASGNSTSAPLSHRSDIIRTPYPTTGQLGPLPISRAVTAGNLVHVSGMLGTVPGAGLAAGFEAQTERAIANVADALASTGHDLSDVATCTVYLVDMKDFAAFNPIFAKAFAAHPPARTTVAVSALPLGGLIEITCTAQRRAKG
jgi:2-iminobutanoate/2-iminopropanoate deaminase